MATRVPPSQAWKLTLGGGLFSPKPAVPFHGESSVCVTPNSPFTCSVNKEKAHWTLGVSPLSLLGRRDDREQLAPATPCEQLSLGCCLTIWGHLFKKEFLVFEEK